MGRGGKHSHLLSTLEAPPLGCGGLEIVLVSICMCQRDSQCVFHAAALEVPVHLNPVGGEVGVGIARRRLGGGRRWDLLGSLSFLLREQLRFPAGDGWPGLRGDAVADCSFSLSLRRQMQLPGPCPPAPSQHHPSLLSCLFPPGQ